MTMPLSSPPSPSSSDSSSSSSPVIFPLRWESTGEQWWYAYPIDYAAANGYYDVVRQLLHIDPNLLIKLTSLRRIQRLDTLWGDSSFNSMAKCRAHVAKNLLLDCERDVDDTVGRRSSNTLIRAGYGGWILYTAASAGDVDFVKEVLGRDPVLLFGEGEFGVTDLLYAAAKSKCDEVFKLLLNSAITVKKNTSSSSYGDGDDDGGAFEWEMMNRALHALARGGNLELLKEQLLDLTDILSYRDGQGSTVLHAAAGRGQLKVVKYLMTAYPDTTESTDHQGNTPLHIAAYRGFTDVVHTLLLLDDPQTPKAVKLPPIAEALNNHGDSFLHTAIASLHTPGFHRVDLQLNLIKQLLLNNNNLIVVNHLINIQNNQGKTPLHLAVTTTGSTTSESIVDLLMKVESINLNLCDRDGLTPLDLLRQSSSSSQLLIKKLVSAGAVSSKSSMLYGDDWRVTRSSPLASHLRRGVGCGFGVSTDISPGTSFRIPDSEIFLYSGDEEEEDDDVFVDDDDDEVEGIDYQQQLSSSSPLWINGNNHDSPIPVTGGGAGDSLYTAKKKLNPTNSATRRLKELMQFTKRKKEDEELLDNSSYSSYQTTTTAAPPPPPTSLRERFTTKTYTPPTTTTTTALPNNKRVIPIDSPITSPIPTTTTAVKKFSHTLSQGVIQPTTTTTAAALSSSSEPSSPSSVPSSPPASTKLFAAAANKPQRSKSLTPARGIMSKSKLMNHRYLCFGAQGLTVDEPTLHFQHCHYEPNTVS